MEQPKQPHGDESQTGKPLDPAPLPEQHSTTKKYKKIAKRYIDSAGHGLRYVWSALARIVGWLDSHGGSLTAVATVAIAVLTYYVAHYAAEQGGLANGQLIAMQGQLGEMKSSSRQTDKLISSNADLAAAAKTQADAAKIQAEATVKQANAQTDQLKIMQGQLDQMREDSRPWIGLSLIQNDAAIQSGKAFKTIVFVKDVGRGPAPFVTACVGSINIVAADQSKASIDKFRAALKCPTLSESVFLPNAESSYDISLRPEQITEPVATAINNDSMAIFVLGRIDYRDNRGTPYWTIFCSRFDHQHGQFNACEYGNDAH